MTSRTDEVIWTGGHYISKCERCQKVISQCRCPSKDKLVQWTICDECKHSSFEERVQKYDVDAKEVSGEKTPTENIIKSFEEAEKAISIISEQIVEINKTLQILRKLVPLCKDNAWGLLEVKKDCEVYKRIFTILKEEIKREERESGKSKEETFEVR